MDNALESLIAERKAFAEAARVGMWPSGSVGRRRLLLASSAAFLGPSLPPSVTAAAPLFQPARVRLADGTANPTSVQLSDGSNFPLASFGVQIYDDATAREATLRALECGFRAFFTSPEAGNQRGFARAIRECGVPRDELYIAGSVLSDNADSFRSARELTARECDASLEVLSAGSGGLLDRLDMLMLERPAITRGAIRGQWKEVQDRRAAGACSSAGVCNFDIGQLDEICLAGARYRPQINQIPYNLALRMPHAQVLAQHAERRVACMAWGPLGGPEALIPRSLLDECAAIGRRSGKSGYQVALRC